MVSFCLLHRVNVNAHHQMRAWTIQMWRMRRYQPRNRHISKGNYHSWTVHSHYVPRVHLLPLRVHGVLMTSVKIKFLLKLLTIKYLDISVKCTLPVLPMVKFCNTCHRLDICLGQLRLVVSLFQIIDQIIQKNILKNPGDVLIHSPVEISLCCRTHKKNTGIIQN